MINLEIKEYSELIALSKVLSFVKYKCHDYDCKEFACSPYIGELYEQVMAKLTPYYQQKNPDFTFDNAFIEQNQSFIDTIKNHISHIENWDVYDLELRKDIVKTMIFPLKYTDETMNKLINKK